ncbi:ParB protein [Clostridium carnis]|uniref:ParB protein n=1 Tax=Clostridium carnis TaxID=1530 RepID=A0ABY6T0J2_9CLOT|nr:ParB N-terminal domain-containing protein [Clostridium carnis]VDG74556.1 ParB protein [Clostridium carnis]
MSSYLKGIANRVNGVEKNSFTKELDINSLVPSQNNFYGIREIEELAESIKENGLMHNLVVRKLDNGTYEILSGERRYRACKLNGLNKIPCLIKENLSDLDAELLLIQANSEQRELTPTEKMEGIKRLEAIYKQKRRNGEKLEGKTRDLIGKDLGLSGVQVGRYQKVDKDLIEPLKEKLDKDEITLTQAHTLSSLTKNEQNIIHEEIKGMNAKEHKEELETLVNGIKQPITSKKDKKLLEEIYPTKNEALKFLQNAIDEFQLNPKVIIKANNIESVLYTSLFKIQDNLLKIEIRGFSRTSTLNINVKSFRKAMSVEIEPGKILTHEHLFLINNDIYVWFTEKFDFNK